MTMKMTVKNESENDDGGENDNENDYFRDIFTHSLSFLCVKTLLTAQNIVVRSRVIGGTGSDTDSNLRRG